MRAILVLISFVGVLLGAWTGWQIGLLLGLGLLPVPMLAVPAGVSTMATAWGFAIGSALLGGLLGGAACLLLARILARLAGPQH